MLVNYVFANNSSFPTIGQGCLYEYLVGSNGVFVRAQRPDIMACIPVSEFENPLRGLLAVPDMVRLSSRVPAWLLGRMFEMAYRAGDKEILFYLKANPWRLVIPEQVQKGASVHPVNPFVGGADTVIEVHSHHRMEAFFSGQDDREEAAGFRIYVVIGNLYGQRPSILARVGIYGHFCEINASLVFDLPPAVKSIFEPVREEPQYESIDDIN